MFEKSGIGTWAGRVTLLSFSESTLNPTRSEKTLMIMPSISLIHLMVGLELQKSKPVDCSLCDFRHTFATRMAERGMPYVVLQAIMGHADISITLQYYVDITPEQMAAAAEMMVTNF